MNKFKQMIAITLVLALICSVSVSAFPSPIPISPVVLTGQSLSTESATQPARVYIFDLTTMQEASLSIYRSYQTFLLTHSHGEMVSPMDASDEWDYGDTTIVSYLYIEGPTLSYYGAQMESYAGHQLESMGTRVRIYSSTNPSISDTPLADSGYVYDTFVSGISATTRTRSSLANGIIGTVSGEHGTYGFFAFTLRGNF